MPTARDRDLAEKPRPGPVELSLQAEFEAAEIAREAVRVAIEIGAPPDEVREKRLAAELAQRTVARKKAAAFVARGFSAGDEFMGNGVRVVLRRDARVTGGILEVAVTAFDAKSGARIPVDNPYGFVNPPLKTPDGTMRVERVDEQDVEVANRTENLDAAFSEILTQAVAAQARRMGWGG